MHQKGSMIGTSQMCHMVIKLMYFLNSTKRQLPSSNNECSLFSLRWDVSILLVICNAILSSIKQSRESKVQRPCTVTKGRLQLYSAHKEVKLLLSGSQQHQAKYFTDISIIQKEESRVKLTKTAKGISVDAVLHRKP